MINLDNARLVGKGRHRECYQHPGHDDLCVKVVVGDYQKEILRENNYYRALQKRQISWRLLPQYHGDVETSLGAGSVYDLVTNSDGSPASNLEYYLSSSATTSRYFDGILSSLADLKKYLLEQSIVTVDIKPRNIVCQVDQSEISKAFIVDDIGNTELIPVSSHIRYFSRLKINRKWERFEKLLAASFRDNDQLENLLSQLREV